MEFISGTSCVNMLVISLMLGDLEPVCIGPQTFVYYFFFCLAYLTEFNEVDGKNNFPDVQHFHILGTGQYLLGSWDWCILNFQCEKSLYLILRENNQTLLSYHC